MRRNEDEDKFKSMQMFTFVIGLLGLFAPILMILYFVADDKEFVITILKWSAILLVIGPLLNVTGIYRLVVSYLRHSEFSCGLW